jgi:outer membrane lipoprotein
MMQLEVAQLELHSNGVPDESSHSGGRFLVVSGELLDPVFYRPGSFVTVIGEIKGQKIQKLGGADYRYPLISAKEIRLFREPDASIARPVNPYQNQVGDDKFLLRPPGALEGEPRKP